MPYRSLNLEATPRREALRLIVEVFRDGHQAAEDLRSCAQELTPHQLETQLQAIEERMISQIAVICDSYEHREHPAARN